MSVDDMDTLVKHRNYLLKTIVEMRDTIEELNTMIADAQSALVIIEARILRAQSGASMQ